MSSLGRAYSKADFVSFYGGTAEWERSPVYHPPAGPGGAAPSEHHKSATEAKAEALLHSKTGQKMQAAAADWGLPASSEDAAELDKQAASFLGSFVTAAPASASRPPRRGVPALAVAGAAGLAAAALAAAWKVSARRPAASPAGPSLV